MKDFDHVPKLASAAAVLAGAILLLGVVFSFRTVAAMCGLLLLIWGISRCRE